MMIQAAAVLSLVLFLGTGVTFAQAILPPPFGLQWGGNMDKVLDWAETEKLDMTIEIKGTQPDLRVIRVTSAKGPLPGSRAFSLETRYHRGRLFEVTVHYGERGAKPAALKLDFDKLKTALTVKHGRFTPNNKQKKEGDGFVRESVSYHIEPVKGLMLMMMFVEMEDTLRKKRSARFSLLYRNQNIIPK